MWLICVALFFLFGATRIEQLGLAGGDDPGPRAFPFVLSTLLLLGGIAQIVRSLLGPKLDPVEKVAVPGGRRQAVLLTLSLVIYLVSVPWVGFYPPTFIFSLFMTRRLGARWWVAALTALTLILVIRVLFVELFRVQLPRGEFGVWL